MRKKPNHPQKDKVQVTSTSPSTLLFLLTTCITVDPGGCKYKFTVYICTGFVQILLSFQMEPREAAECPAGPEVPLLPDRGSQQHHQDHQWAHHGADPPEELRQTGGCTIL